MQIGGNKGRVFQPFWQITIQPKTWVEGMKHTAAAVVGGGGGVLERTIPTVALSTSLSILASIDIEKLLLKKPTKIRLFSFSIFS
jgi:hypothetical protein